MLRRVDAENRIQTLKEELEFQKSLYSEVSLSDAVIPITIITILTVELRDKFICSNFKL